MRDLERALTGGDGPVWAAASAGGDEHAHGDDDQGRCEVDAPGEEVPESQDAKTDAAANKSESADASSTEDPETVLGDADKEQCGGAVPAKKMPDPDESVQSKGIAALGVEEAEGAQGNGN